MKGNKGTSMGGIFRYDGSVASAILAAVKLIRFNLLWLVCCVPVVTAGASTTALLHVCMACHCGNDPDSSDFFIAFRKNFRQATFLWLGFAVLGAALIFDWYFLFHIAPCMLRKIGMLLTSLVSLTYVFSLTFLFPLQAHFDNSVMRTLENSLRFGFANPLKTLCLAAWNAIPLLLIHFTSGGLVVLFFGIAPIAYLDCYFFLKIFNRYIAN